MKVQPKEALLDANQKPLQPFFERHATLVSLSIVICWLVVGIVLGMLVEGWPFLTSVYAAMQVMTTIGYGDITPKTALMRWFMCFYVIFGIAIVANIVNEVVGQVLQWQMDAMRARMRAVEAGEREEVVTAKYGIWNRLLAATAVFALTLVVSATFYATVESCSCSYGATAIEGCIPGDACSKKGQVKTWDEALYMAVITFATIGFGDFTPLTEVGRAVAVPLSIVGVAAAANFLANISNTIAEVRKRKKAERRVTADVLKMMDTDRDGLVSKTEFRMYMLLKEGVIEKEDLEHIDAAFYAIDKRGSGSIPVGEVSKRFDRTA